MEITRCSLQMGQITIKNSQKVRKNLSLPLNITKYINMLLTKALKSSRSSKRIEK